MIDMLYGARNEIIGGIVLMLLVWCWHKFRVMLKKYKTMKHELERMREEMTQIGATKEEHERLTAEIQRKDEALSQSAAKSQEDSRRITELRSQTEARQKELQRKDEALSQSAAKSQEASQRITELRSQIETLQQELEREKARKKIPPMSDDDFLELCKSGSAQKVKEAIMNGANVNAKDKSGNTALIWATIYGQTEIVIILLKHGADVNAKDNNGRRALMYAVQNSAIADLLRRYGAN